MKNYKIKFYSNVLEKDITLILDVISEYKTKMAFTFNGWPHDEIGYDDEKYQSFKKEVFQFLENNW